MPRLATVTACLALLAVSCGGDDAGPASDSGPRRTVDVTMTDLKFTPDMLSVARGETVTFRFRNEGKVPHDAYVGDAAAQQEHEKDMRGDGGHDHGADGDDAVTVPPGGTGELTYSFTNAGTVEVGCHQPGHYGAGMKIVVTVA